MPCDVYLLNVRASKAQKARASKLRTTVREYDVFHDLLTDVLNAAGLEGPVRELADMRDDGVPKDSPAQSAHCD